MSERNSLILVGGSIGCLVILFCVGVAVLAAIGIFGKRAIWTRPVDLIAYMDNDLNIDVVDPRGEHRVALTADANASNDLAYIFPTWSPDSQHLAFVRVSGTRNTRQGILFVAPASGGNLATVFKSGSQIPFYLYWAPDSQRIGFLAQSDTELSFMLGNADGKGDARRLDTGAPFYWAWSPDSRTMLTHVGGSKRDSLQARLALLRWQNSDSLETLSQVPAAFQAPQFSPDGSAILYAGTGDADQDALYVADARGGHAQLIANYKGRIGFAWSPDGKKIAWMITSEDSALPYLGPVFVSDSDGKNSKPLTNQDSLAFYWSSDSKRIAFLTLFARGSQGREENGTRTPGLSAPLEQGRGLSLRWRIVDVEDAQARTLVTFVPTANFLAVLPYFDQYARSLTFWSPDGQHFVYTQRESSDAGSVWVIDVVEGALPRKIADGTLAVWSWR